MLTDKELTENSEALILLANHVMALESIPRPYNHETMLSMNEIHILASIAEHPGIFSKDLTVLRHKSKSFISQIIARLKNLDLIVKKTDPRNNRRKGLYPTEKGLALMKIHSSYDQVRLWQTYQAVRRSCSDEEILAFCKVMAACNVYLKKVLENGNHFPDLEVG